MLPGMQNMEPRMLNKRQGQDFKLSRSGINGNQDYIVMLLRFFCGITSPAQIVSADVGRIIAGPEYRARA